MNLFHGMNWSRNTRQNFASALDHRQTPFCMALGTLIIKVRLGLTDKELVEQIKSNPYLQFFIGMEGFQYLAPSDPTMMVYFRKRLLEAVVDDCNKSIMRHVLNMIRASEMEDHDKDESQGGTEAFSILCKTLAQRR